MGIGGFVVMQNMLRSSRGRGGGGTPKWWEFILVIVVIIAALLIFVGILETLATWTESDATLVEVIRQEWRWFIALLHRIW